ncbi:MAG TPA: cytochrome P450 [Vicinamibacterales bacterium]|nr:cytochrome P450 [Vicinamibacterales bacterium]
MSVVTTYLDQFDVAPVDQRHQLVRQWMQDDPLTFFRELREERPILATPACTLVARFDDVIEVLGMPKIFTAALYLPKMSNGIYLMAHDDDALHTREKSLMQGLLNRDDLPRVRTMVQRIATEILAAAAGTMDAIDGYCRLVPATLVQEYFGLTGIDRRTLIEWSYWNQADTFYNQPFDILSDERRREIETRHEQTGRALGQYITGLIARRFVAVKAEQAERALFFPLLLVRRLVRRFIGATAEPLTDDIVTRMLRTAYPDAVDFNIERVGVNAGGLLIGAIETTSQAVAQVVQYLLGDVRLLADAQRAARATDVTEFDGIVWEALRFVPISSYIFRKAAADVTIAKGTDRETTIKAGTIVLALTQSAMFDPRAFERPEQFIPGRNWYRYFHFGFGSHECLGRYVGMVMIPEMVRQLLLRPSLRAPQPIDYEGGHLPQHYALTWAA